MSGDIASAMLLLASDKTSYIAGQMTIADGRSMFSEGPVMQRKTYNKVLEKELRNYD